MAKKGHIPWNKGQHWDDKTKEKISKSKKGKLTGVDNPMYGKTHSQITKDNWSNKRRGIKLSVEHKQKIKENIKTNLNFGMCGKQHTDKTKKKIAISKKGIVSSLKGKKGHIAWNKGMKLCEFLHISTEEWGARLAEGQQRKPNKLEQHILNIVNEEFNYVGDGKLWIGNKNPDFIHKKDKIIIEVFGDYWHKEEDVTKRITCFSKSGYKTIILWEHDINSKTDNEIRSMIQC